MCWFSLNLNFQTFLEYRYIYFFKQSVKQILLYHKFIGIHFFQNRDTQIIYYTPENFYFQYTCISCISCSCKLNFGSGSKLPRIRFFFFRIFKRCINYFMFFCQTYFIIIFFNNVSKHLPWETDGLGSLDLLVDSFSWITLDS